MFVFSKSEIYGSVSSYDNNDEPVFTITIMMSKMGIFSYDDYDDDDSVFKGFKFTISMTI